MINVIIGILIPFFGTALGSFFVFFINEKLNMKIKKIMLGFAAGIMTSASVWSLLIPAIEQSEADGLVGFIPASVGLIFGFLLLFLIEKLNKQILNKNKLNEQKTNKKSLLVFSITLHNIPEGMAVGVAIAGAYYGNSLLSLTAAIMLAIGIAVQNIPEGAIVSMPLKLKGCSKTKSFMIGVCSGAVEPIFAIITFFITGFVSAILPYVLAFAAGSMLYVVVDEIIPEMQEDNNGLATMGFMLGFVIMLILDLVLG